MDAVKRLLALLLVVTPSVAAACPNCVGNQSNSTAILKMVGLFMLVPFTVFYVVLRIIRRAQSEADLIEK